MPRRAYTAADVESFFTELRTLVTIEQDRDDANWRLDALIRFWFYAMQEAPPGQVETALTLALEWAHRHALIATLSPTVH